MTTATVKHLHIKRRMLREVIVFAELLLRAAEVQTTPLRASDILQEPVFLLLFIYFSFYNVIFLLVLVSQRRRLQTVSNA